jgi:hypothetical protein
MKIYSADNVTDAEIRWLRDSVPEGHVNAQWCDDALSSFSAPQRRWSSRHMCAVVLNTERILGRLPRA